MEKSRGKVIQPEKMNWEPHPQLKTAKVVYLLSNRDEKADLTFMLVRLPKGTQVEKHIHASSDDIIYVRFEDGARAPTSCARGCAPRRADSAVPRAP